MDPTQLTGILETVQGLLATYGLKVVGAGLLDGLFAKR